jgi:rod shape-determining protein MreC
MLAAQKADLRLFVTFISASILLFILDYFGALNLPRSGVQMVAAPIQYGLYKTSLGVGRQFEFIILSRRASQENKALGEQLAQVLSENAQLRKKMAETQAFEDQQKMLSSQTFTYKAARPIGYTRYLLIDKGSDDGLKVGQSVVYKDNFIGQIKEVSPKKSQVMLPMDPDSHIAAFSSNEQGKAKGVLDGRYGSEMLLNKVLHEENIVKDELVYSEGTEVDIPRGLILGQVSEVLEKDNEVFKQAKVKPVFDVGNLEVVFVITNL